MGSEDHHEVNADQERESQNQTAGSSDAGRCGDVQHPVVPIILYQTNSTDAKTMQSAVDALKDDLDPQLDFNLNVTTRSINFKAASTDWDTILEKFEDIVNSNYDILDHEYHLVVIDHITFDLDWSVEPSFEPIKIDAEYGPGAGITYGSVGRNAAVGGVNAGMKDYLKHLRVEVPKIPVDISVLYGGDPTKIFKNTVIHETLHAMTDLDFNKYPAESCAPEEQNYSGGNLLHSLGQVYTSRWNNPVSPFMTWYTISPLSGNQPPCNSCNEQPNAKAKGITPELSSCSQRAVHQYVLSNVPNTIVIKGSGEVNGINAVYEIEVSGTIEPIEGELILGDEVVTVSKNKADQVSESSAGGTVWSGVDGYQFTGGITSLTVLPSDRAIVYVNGERCIPDYGHSLAISGEEGDTRVEYEVEVSERLKGFNGKLPAGERWVHVGLNEPDIVRERSAQGTVIGGQDGFVFAGRIESLIVVPPNEATVYVDGQRRSPDYSRTLVISGTDEDLKTAYEVAVTGDIQGYDGNLPAGDGMIGAGLNDPDKVGEKSAEGTVTGGADGFVFNGELTELFVAPPNGAEVYVDGKPQAPDYPHTLVIDGVEGGPGATYELEVTGKLQGYNGKLPAGDGMTWVSIDETEEVGENSAEGTVVNAADGYLYAGEIADLEITPSEEAEVYVDGERRPVDGEDNEAPSAVFDISPKSPLSAEEVTFDASESNDPDGSITNYEWGFREKPNKNPATDSGKITSRTFSAGTYAITLAVTDDDGATATTSKTLEVNHPPKAQFDISPSLPVAGEEVTLDATHSTDPDGSISSYEWEIYRAEDGTIDSDPITTLTGTTVAYSFDDPVTYSVQLRVRDNSGATTTTSEMIEVVIPPEASFEMEPSEPHADEEVTFDASRSTDPDGSIVSYEWEFREKPNKNPIPDTGERVSRRFSPGEYAITLRVTDDSDKMDTTTKSLNVSPSPESPVSRFNVTPEAPQPDQTVTFDASESSDPDGSIVSYEWEIYRAEDGTIDSEPIATLAGESATYSFSDSISYASKLAVTDDSGMTDTSSKVIAVNSPPEAAFDISPKEPSSGEEVTFDASESSDPDGSIVSYEWEFRKKPNKNPQPDSGTKVTRTFVPGTYDITLRVTDDDGATAMTSQQLEVQANRPPSASIDAAPEQVYVGDTITLDGSGSTDPDGEVVSYTWNIDPPSGSTTEKSGSGITYGVSSEGTHQISLLVTDDEGATDSMETSFRARKDNRPPNATIDAPDQDVYRTETHTFDASRSTDPDGTITNYDWTLEHSTAGVVATGSGEQFTHRFTRTGRFTVRVTVSDEAGATDTARTTVDVQEPPIKPMESGSNDDTDE